MQQEIKLFNTESRQKEVTHFDLKKPVLVYTCGPTVYNFAHIGNFRTYVFEDLLRRTIQFFGYKIHQVMNLTDIDDKTLKGAIEKNISLKEFTRPFEKAFFEDLDTLNIQRAEHYPEATAYIAEMIKIIAALLEKGYAYRGTDQSIYYSIRKFPSYGRLSHLVLEDLKEGASGVATDEYEKENAADFVLWKAYDPRRDGNLFWDSPFGLGRPGWHIECSAMALKLLGPQIDIHCGGIDNMFPHHENEIAQSEGYTGKQFVKIWMHSEHLVVDGKKMSKSLGNFFTLRDLIQKGYSGREVRFMLLQAHYRTQLNFTFQGLESARKSLLRLQDFILRMKSISDPKFYGSVEEIIQKTNDEFSSSIADDLNISEALASLFIFVTKINCLADENHIGTMEAQLVLQFLHRIDEVLGFLPLKEQQEEIPEEVQRAIKERELARKEKRWKDSDTLREFIHSKGYILEDTAQGQKIKKDSC